MSKIYRSFIAIQCQFLTQLRRLAFKIIHLTTIILPAWKETLETLGLEVHLMPCNVATRWNSSGDMVDFTINYQEGIEVLTQKKNLGLREFELSDEKWAVLRELREVLKVSRHTQSPHTSASKHTSTKPTDSEGCHFVLLVCQPQPCDGDPCNGSYQQGVHNVCPGCKFIFTPHLSHLRNGQEDLELLLRSHGRVSPLSHSYG